MRLGDAFFKLFQGTNRFRFIWGRIQGLTRPSGWQVLMRDAQNQGIRRLQNFEIPGNADQRGPSAPAQAPSSGAAHWQVGPVKIPKPNSVLQRFRHPKGENTGTATDGAQVATLSPNGQAQWDPAGSPLPTGQELQEAIPSTTPLYPEYRCVRNHPLSCDFPQKTLQEATKAKFCSRCGFPVPLPPRQEIRGRRGLYRISHSLGHRGLGRLYAAHANDGQPVVVKEYLLPNRSFPSLAEIQQRQATFASIAGVGAADGRVQDFRLLPTWEAIPDQHGRRCYLVTRGTIGAAETLNHYLSERGAMDAEYVRRLLDQVLQTLEFMHGQKFQFASGHMRQGLVHGGISLDSLLIAPPNPNFFIYICDLTLWEYLFDPIPNPVKTESPQTDLNALGHVGFYLLAGRAVDQVTGQYLDPRDPQQWPQVDHNTRTFLMQLMGYHQPAFESATVARQVLWDLPPVGQEEWGALSGSEEEQQHHKRRSRGWKRWLWVFLVLLFCGLGVWAWNLIWGGSGDEDPRVPLVPLMVDVNTVPQGEFRFTTEEPGSTHYSFVKLRPSNRLSGGNNVIGAIESTFSRLQLGVGTTASSALAQQQVIDQQVNFAITGLDYVPHDDGIDRCNSPLSDQLNRCDVVYDGILVYVPFIYANRNEGLPRALRGRISFEQLRQLYTGEISSWRELGGPERRVQLNVPLEPEVIRLFEQRVLQNDFAIQDFRDRIARGEILQEETFDTMGRIRAEFEEQVSIGGIGFGLISKLFGDCNVYPLALESDEGESGWFGQAAVQPVTTGATLVGGKGSITPNTDLCQLKGQYQLSEPDFRSGRYPLAYPLSVIYPRDNRQQDQFRIGGKIAEVLRTREGQCLLKNNANLIPLQPVSCEGD